MNASPRLTSQLEGFRSAPAAKLSLAFCVLLTSLTACRMGGGLNNEENAIDYVDPEEQRQISGFDIARDPSSVDPNASPSPDAEGEGSEPVISAVAPSEGPLAGGTVVTLTGDAFKMGSGFTVLFGDQECTNLSHPSKTEVICTTPAGSAGAVTLTVSNSNGKSGVLASAFTYAAPPTITEVQPASGRIAGGATLTVSGSGFRQGAKIRIGTQYCAAAEAERPSSDADAAAFVSETELRCVAPAATGAGTYDLAVENSSALLTTLANAFKYNAIPSVTGVSPSTGLSTGNTTIVVTGTDFLSGATVTVGGAPCASVNVASTTNLSCVTSARSAGTADVVVTNFDTQSGTMSGGYSYLALASLAFSAQPSYDFGSVTVGASLARTYTLTNSGAATATSITVNVTASTPYSLSNDLCTGSLAGGESCTYRISYAPSGAASHAATIAVQYNDGSATQNMTQALSGAGLTPASLGLAGSGSFGNTVVTTSGTKTFTLTNSGQTTASGVSLSLNTGTAYSIPGGSNGCASTLGGGGSCAFDVSYAPGGVGASNDSLNVTYNNGVSGGNSSAVALSGTGVSAASIAVASGLSQSGGAYDFGSKAIGSATAITFTLTNSGGWPAVVSGASVATNQYILTSTCSTLSASGNCTFTVSFAPTGSAGARADTLAVTYNNGTATPVTTNQPITGSALSVAALAVQGTSPYDFGIKAIGSSTDRTFTLTNSGAVAATGVSLSAVSGSYFSLPDTSACGATLNSGGNCAFTARYSPTGGAATHADSIQVSFNNGAAADSATFGLGGEGRSPASLAVSGSTLSFSNPNYLWSSKPTGSTTDATFTVTNSGGVAAASAAVSENSSNHSIVTDGCASSPPAAGGTCTFVARYSPSGAPGAQDVTYTVTFHNGAASGQTSTATATATNAAPASLALTPSTTPFSFGAVFTGTNQDATFTLSNSGSWEASSLSVSGLAAPYSVASSGCAATLAAGGNCAFTVRFNPSTSAANQVDTLEISYGNGVNTQNLSRDLTGDGRSHATLAIAGSGAADPYDYGTKVNGSSTSVTFTLTNSSTQTNATSVTLSTESGGSIHTLAAGGGTPCTGTLNASSSCTLVATYAPSSNATHADTLKVAFNDGVSATTATRGVTGAAVSAASLAMTPATSPYDYGQVYVGNTGSMTFTLSNSGATTATSLNKTGLAAPYAFNGGTCGTSLTAGSTCTLQVDYTPGSAGTDHADTIELSYESGAATVNLTRALVGDGVAPASLAVSGSTLTFSNPDYQWGSKPTGSATDATFTVTNSGGVAASSASVTESSAYHSIVTDGCASSPPAAGGTCTFVARYSPSGGAGAQNVTYTVTYHNGAASGQTATATATATNVAPASLALTPSTSPYSFGTVFTGVNSDATFTLSNSGGWAATSLGITGLAAPYSVASSGCGTSLAANGSCTFVVRFTPSTGTAAQLDTIDVSYSDGVNAQSISRGVTGDGRTRASIAITGNGAADPYDFGAKVAGSNTSVTFTLTNSSSQTNATGVTLSVEGGANYSVAAGGGTPCGGTLNASSTCTLVATYTPSSAGTHTDTLNVAYNDGVAATTSARGVTGTAAAAASLSVTPAGTYDFGTTIIGATGSKTFTLANSGGVTATSINKGGLASPYVHNGGTCGTSLAAGNACTFIVDYTPTGSGSGQADTAEITYHDGAANQTASGALTGTGTTPATLAITPTTAYDFGILTTFASGKKTFTLSNSGETIATGIGDSGLTAPFSTSMPGGGACGSSLAGGAACTFTVTFQSTANSTTSYSDTVEVAYNNGLGVASPATRGVSGIGVKPIPQLPQQFLSMNYTPDAYSSADFDNDGIPDYLVTQRGTGQGAIGIIKGEKSGFQVHMPLSGSPIAVGDSAVMSGGIGDFNNDGAKDIIVALPDTNEIRVGLGDKTGGIPDGTFTFEADLSVGSAPQALVVSDFNGDGRSDFAVAHFLGDTIGVYLRNADGSWSQATGSPNAAGDGPKALVLGKFDNDNIDDLVVASQNDDSIQFFSGNADGTFDAAVTTANMADSPIRIASGDWDNDGDLDLAIAHTAGATYDVKIALGANNGTFSAGTALANSVSQYTRDVVSHDFDGDGDEDLVVAVASTAKALKYWKCNGNGTFTETDYGQSVTFSAIGKADADADGDMDLIFGGISAPNETGIIHNWGVSGGNVTWNLNELITAENDPVAVIAADFNADGFTDLAISNKATGNVSVVLRNGTSGWIAATQYSTAFTAGTFKGGIGAGDFDGDGDKDIAAAAGGNLKILTNNGAGSFAVGNAIALGDINAVSLTVANFDNDANKRDDLAISMADPPTSISKVKVLLRNAANDGFDLSTLNSEATSDEPWQIGSGDVNGDGKIDILVALKYANKLGVYINSNLTSFDAIRTFASGGSGTNGPLGLGVGDLNNDGKADAAVLNATTGSEITLFANYNGANHTWGSTVTKAGVPPTPNTGAKQSVTIADINGDGNKDMVIALVGKSEVDVIFGNGAGDTSSYYLKRILSLPNMTGAAVADIDKDGTPDIISCSETHASNSCAVHYATD